MIPLKPRAAAHAIKAAEAPKCREAPEKELPVVGARIVGVIWEPAASQINPSPPRSFRRTRGIEYRVGQRKLIARHAAMDADGRNVATGRKAVATKATQIKVREVGLTALTALGFPAAASASMSKTSLKTKQIG